jgi:alkanesulfonate monooxygenase SsuD/methylene tetrahydromethanopterin reductase-like flavin-dependent oxidoreductase (luciferase family)
MAEAAPPNRCDGSGSFFEGRDRSRSARLGPDFGKFSNAGMGQKPLAPIRRRVRALGRKPDPTNWRVAKSIFVADDDKTAKAYATGASSPYRYYYSQLFTKLRKGRLELFKTRRDQPDDEVTPDEICKELIIIYGSPEKVIDDILQFRERVGDFGTLLYAGKDWHDPELGKRSMILMAEKVLPKINAAITA